MSIMMVVITLSLPSYSQDMISIAHTSENLTPTSQDEFEFEYKSDHSATLIYWKNEVRINDLFGSSGTNVKLLEEIQSDGLVPQVDGVELRDLVIPSTITKNGAEYIVTVIDDSAFSQVYNVRSIYLPNTIEKIRREAFYCCMNLQKINIPASVTTLSIEDVFASCVSLTSIDVDPSNDEFCSVDGVLFTKDMTELRYYPCGRKETYNIPSSVEKIGKTAFKGAIFLTSIGWGDNVTTLGTYAFQICLSLKELVIKEGLTHIYRAFQDCIFLEKVDIPSTVKQIGDKDFEHDFNPFYQCDNMKSVIIRAVDPPLFYNGPWWWGNFNITVRPTLYVPQLSIQKYKDYVMHSDFHTYVENFSEILPLEDYVIDEDPTIINSVPNEDCTYSVYDLMGIEKLVTPHKEEINNLEKGTYIINGKKYVIR